MRKNHLPLASAITLVAGLTLFFGLGRIIHGEQASAATSPAPALGPVHVLKITVLSTMLTDAVGVGEWGFSALVEVDGQRVLFDTGGRPETVLNNARELGVDLSNVEDVILSHNHWDHVTGLVTFPEKNYPAMIHYRDSDGNLVLDNIPEDQSLVLDTDKGLVVLIGCGHAGLINILTYARQTVRPGAQVYAALGGFHLFAAKADTLSWTADKLKEFGVGQIMGAHCTGIEPVYYFRERLGLERKACVVGAVGSFFELAKGING
jgi:metal-dependent hydrolase (beta-lactamase superfamily II)